MSDLGNAKIFGGVGALLSLFGVFIPTVGPFVSIVGLILIFIAVKSISEITKDHEIYKNFLNFFILNIISIVAIFVIMIIGFGAVGGFSWFTELQSANITDFNTFLDYFENIIVFCALALIIGWILLMIAAIYLRRSYNLIAEHTEVNLFKTTGTLYFIGAITTIVLIGFFILFIGGIVEIIAYFSLPDDLSKGDKKEKSERRCPNCDRIIPEDAVSCPYCSKKLT